MIMATSVRSGCLRSIACGALACALSFPRVEAQPSRPRFHPVAPTPIPGIDRDIPRAGPTVPMPTSPSETLADALSDAYRSNPSLQARRYELRATDEDYAQALAELRPTAELQLDGGYDKTVPGRATQADRPFFDRLGSSIITTNTMGVQVVVDQPITTGGRATADRLAADAAIRAGRAALRGTEGDLFVQVITSYVDIRRDTAALAIRQANLAQLQATLDEVKARREAGELTRTDIAQAETQLYAARTLTNAVEAQLEQDRATFAALVGRNPGVLAGEPQLPQLPVSIDEAFDRAAQTSPDLAQAIMTERSSRARIDAAAAEGQPRISLRGTARLSGQATPFQLRNEDQGFTGRAVLTVPLSQGGRVASLTAQAADRNSADRLRIEATRRAVVLSIIDAWNNRATAQRNIAAQSAQLESAQTFYEGTFEEYRAGLRSTFDVLFAQGTLRDSQIALLGSRRDLYVAEATLLRHIGVLEARSILTGTGLYDPSVAFRHSTRRSSLPWDGALRAFDGAYRERVRQRSLEQPENPTVPPRIVPATSGMTTDGELTRTSPSVPIGGTTGNPQKRKRR
jgi:outer membrane protein